MKILKYISNNIIYIMSEIVTPYLNTELRSKVTLKPYQMNNDIYINLKTNLKKKVEKKCNKYGYVTKIFKILEHKNGLIECGDFSASAIYNVKYSARMCIPIENTKIICKVSKMNSVVLIVDNGPIMCIMKNMDINNKKFTINNKGKILIIKNNKELKENDYVIVKIRGKKFMQNDDRILLLGFLEDVATEKEVNKYFEEDLKTNVEEKIIDNAEYDEEFDEENTELSDEENENQENNLEISKSNYIEI